METSSLFGKRLLILGGNRETGALVEYANTLGICTHVLDPYLDAPAKRYAHKSHNCDAMDIERVITICKNEKIDGVLVGIADILIPSYELICSALNLPCYANKSTINAFSSKSLFIKSCQKYSIDTVQTIPSAKINLISDSDFPLIVKPVDNGAGVGMSVCQNHEELKESLKFALDNSKQKKVIIEKFMQCEDMHAYYTFINGEVYLSALADRYKTMLQKIGSPVCIGARYPSIYLTSFLSSVHPRLVAMFNDLGVQNGVLNIQFFHENGKFYAYDPGFRLQGEGPHLHLLAANGFDHRKMLINFALTGKMINEAFECLNDVRFKNTFAATVWVLLNQGTIRNISGLNEIKNLESYKNIIQRFEVGDRVEEGMLGTERQVFARIYLQNSDQTKLLGDIKKLNQSIKVESISNKTMILDSLYRVNHE